MTARKPNSKGIAYRSGGFTLIEIMIVVLIVAVLAGLAFASYQQSIVKTRRSAATACLQEAAQFMDRYYTTNLTYVGATLPAQACSAGDAVTRFYTVTVTGITATTYTMNAAPKPLQSSGDAKCGTLTLNQVGVRTRSGTATTVDECW